MNNYLDNDNDNDNDNEKYLFNHKSTNSKIQQYYYFYKLLIGLETIIKTKIFVAIIIATKKAGLISTMRA